MVGSFRLGMACAFLFLSHELTLSLFHSFIHSFLTACRKLSDETNSIDDLPASCRAYSAIVELMKQKTHRRRPTDPFAGMHAGAAAEAKRAKAEGRGMYLFVGGVYAHAPCQSFFENVSSHFFFILSLFLSNFPFCRIT